MNGQNAAWTSHPTQEPGQRLTDKIRCSGQRARIQSGPVALCLEHHGGPAPPLDQSSLGLRQIVNLH